MVRFLKTVKRHGSTRSRGEDVERDKAHEEASALCAKLRERGDPVSLDAAAMIEGTLDAFTGLVSAMQDLRKRAANLERNLHNTQALFARVPAEHRLRAAHLTEDVRHGR